MCIRVKLSKPLLAMFAIKGKYYKVEYEGLHMICLSCGKYVPYTESCLDSKNEDQGKQGELEIGTIGSIGSRLNNKN